jgi:hypothetical protein
VIEEFCVSPWRCVDHDDVVGSTLPGQVHLLGEALQSEQLVEGFDEDLIDAASVGDDGSVR